MARELGEVRVGDTIEFRDCHEHDGVITNMIDRWGVDRPYILKSEQKEVSRIIVQQCSDKKFAVWNPLEMPSAFCITYRPRYAQ